MLGTPPAVPAAPPAADPFQLGRTYRVETVQGSVFSGVLVSMSLTALEFDSKELGHLKLERGQIRRADLQDAPPVAPAPAATAAVASAPAVATPTRPTTGKSGYYDIGNGNRLFFAPTARNLREGEAVLQDVDVFLAGINYGVTDHLSMGGYISLFPGAELSNQFLALTPKLSYPISEKLYAGAGLLYVRIPTFDSHGSGYGAGIGYGALTYGSADNNFTVGLGYGFVEGKIGSTPMLQIGGQTRVSRLISLVSENYVVADHAAGMAGLYGIKFNWRRTSLGLGALYLYEFEHEETQYNSYYTPGGQYVQTMQTVNTGGRGYSTNVLPVYVDFSFRFGKGAVR
ncbi:hypothetical protein GCM10027594_24910 [Hymenobacter agri]